MHVGSSHSDFEAEESGEGGAFEIINGERAAVEDDVVVGEEDALIEEEEDKGEK